MHYGSSSSRQPLRSLSTGCARETLTASPEQRRAFEPSSKQHKRRPASRPLRSHFFGCAARTLDRFAQYSLEPKTIVK